VPLNDARPLLQGTTGWRVRPAPVRGAAEQPRAPRCRPIRPQPRCPIKHEI